METNMKTLKSLILGALAVAGGWCAQAEEVPVAERYVGGATEPEIITATSTDSRDLDQALFGAVCNVSTSARIVLLRDVVIGDSTTPIWGNNDGYLSSIVFDLNGHTLDASGSYCKTGIGGFGITSICNLTFIDSVGGGKISGHQATCAKESSITFDLPMNSVVSSDTGFRDYNPRGSSEKGAITINGGKYDGCVHGSDGNGTILLTGGFFNKSKNGSITSYNHDTTKYFDNGDGYWRVVPIGWNPVGVKVNGVDLADAPGAGWTYADGVLSLTNAQAYTLSGANTTGAVRIEVTANANVTLNNLELVCDSATADLIRFSGANATLTLSGTSTVYAKNGFAALQVAGGARLAVNGTGELVGGRIGSFYGRGVCVYNGGTLDWNGGTLSDYYFRKSGSTDDKGAGICVFDTGAFNMYGGALKGMYGYDGGAVYTYGGPVNIYGGDIAGNTAAYGAALYCRGTINVYGGNITNNVADGGIACAGSGTISVYGGIVSGNSGDCLFYRDTGTGRLYGAVGTDLAAASPVSGKSVVKVTDKLYAIGENVMSADGKLTGGTYTFNPTNAEYAAAGLALAKGIEVQRQGTNPVTY